MNSSINIFFQFQPFGRIEKTKTVANVRESTYYTKSVPKVVTYKWKGMRKIKQLQNQTAHTNVRLKHFNLPDGNEVDPECKLNENARVFRRCINQREVKYSAILSLVDIQNNKNSYYRMQLLESTERHTNL